MPSAVHPHREPGGVTRLELTQPDGFPRLTLAVLDELDNHLCPLLTDRDCAGIVLQGTKKCFAAGAELSEVNSLSGLAALDYARWTQLLFERIANAPKPVVAAVNGFCLGGGFDLVLSCHWRLATPEALFGHPGATLGLITGWGGTQRLPRLIGRGAALELLLAGKQIGAADALAMGLVDEVLPAESLLPRALERARAAKK